MKHLLPLFALFIAGCAGKKDAALPPPCDDRAKLDGVCPGVSAASIGTDGVACTSQVPVSSSGELTAKAAAAAAGSCLILADGSYGAVTLPAGVSLLGKGASVASVDGITLVGGAAATLRGVTVGAGGIVASGAGALTIDHVMVSHATGNGIGVVDTSVTLLASTIESSGKFGVMVGTSCKQDCGTQPRSKLVLRGVLARENHAVGIWAHGVDVDLAGVQIESTRADHFLYGRGLEVSEDATNADMTPTGQTCSLLASSFAVVKSDEIGLFVEGCSTDISKFYASANTRGVQLQSLPDGAGKIHDFTIEGNAALGLGISDSKGIIVQGGRIASTTAFKVPVDIGGAQEVGDGLNWVKSDISVGDTVHIENSARRGVIIDAASTGKFAGSLGGGDESKGIIVQGGLTASVPDGLSIGAGVKTDVLGKDRAVPLAARVMKKKKE